MVSFEVVIGRFVFKSKLVLSLADALGIAEKTVKIHRDHVRQKMEVSSVAGLVHLCESSCLVPQPLCL